MGSKNSKTEFGYEWKTTCDQVVEGKNLSGKHFLVTGVSLGGMGEAITKSLFNAGATVSMISRNQEKMKAVKEKIESLNKTKEQQGKINSFVCDLSKQKSVKNCIQEIKKALGNTKFDCFIANAGMALTKKQITEDNFEAMMAVCHFGHFSMILGLLEHMNEDGRIVMVSSMSNTYGKINLDDLFFKKEKFKSEKGYGNAKLANIMFAKELNRRLKESGKSIIANSCHPGVVETNFFNNVKFQKVLMYSILYPVMYFYFKSIEQGAATSVFLATDKRITTGGKYFWDCYSTESYNPQAKDEEFCKSFFTKSEEITGFKFPFKKQ